VAHGGEGVPGGPDLNFGHGIRIHR